MACTYSYTDIVTNETIVFATESELNDYLVANKSYITELLGDRFKYQIVGTKGLSNNRILARSYSKALEMYYSKATSEEIFNQTGWERGKDGKWRTKLPTDGIKINKENITKAGATLKMVLDYPALYELYPSLGNLKIDVSPYENKENGKIVATGNGKLFMFINQRLLDQNNPEKLQEVIIHETQHAVQALENFHFSPAKNGDFKDYFNSFSEVEARNAANLSLISDEEKKGITIAATEDVPASEQRLSTPFSQDFKGSVVFSKNKTLSVIESTPYLYKNLVDDGKGNFLFYHFSNQDLLKSGINPNKFGSNLKTSRGEMQAKASVSFYYTNPNTKEAQIGDNGYVVSISKEKVYPFNEDPLNLIDEAEKEFRKVYPNQAFGANQQISWVAKVAANHGYEMVVGKWNGKLRAETTIKFKPQLFEKVVGNTITYKHPEYYNLKVGNKNLLRQDAQGAYDTLQKVIYAITDPNVSTPLHELAHTWEGQLSDIERQSILDWAKHDVWTTDTSEQFARGFEQYLLEGKAKDKGMNNIFEKFAKWLSDIYEKIVKGLKQPLNDSMRDVYSKMLNIKDEVVEKPFTMPSEEDVLNTPYTGTEPDYGRTNQVQRALTNGYYEKQIAAKKLDEAGLRQILASNNLSENLADRVLFNVNNKALVAKINEAIPTDKYNKAYIQQMSKAYKEGTLDEAARKGVVQWQKYYDILNYIGEATPKTNDAKVKAFVQKFYVKDEVVHVEAPVEEVVAPVVTAVPNANAEIERLKSAPKENEDGSTLNLDGSPYTGAGLVVPVASVNVTQSTLSNEALGKFMKDNADKISPNGEFKFGLYKFGNSDKVSLDLNILVNDANIDAALIVGRYLGQESLYNLKTGENIKTGATGNETVNVTPAQIQEIAEALAKGEVPSFISEQTQTKVEEPIIEAPKVEEAPVTEEATKIDEEVAPQPEVIKEEAPVEDGEIRKSDNVVYEGKSLKDIIGKTLKVTDTHESNPEVTDGFVKVQGYDQEVPLFTLRKATAAETEVKTKAEENVESTEVPLVNEDGTTYTPNNKTKFDVGDKLTFEDEEYTVNYVDKGFALDNKGNEIETTIYNATQVKGAKTLNIPESAVKAVKPSAVKQLAKNHMLNVMSNRFKQIFPQIETEIGSFDFDAPARFYQGRVQLNTNYQGIGLFKEGIAHEYMHPFVAALKVSNKYLYNNLLAELKAKQKGIIAEINAKVDQGLYTKEDAMDEALVTYLGREISNAFDEIGAPREYNEQDVIDARKEVAQMDADIKKGLAVDTEAYNAARKVAERVPFIEQQRMTLVAKFTQWWRDIMDFIFGKRKIRSAEDFAQAANNRDSQVKEQMTSFFKQDAGLFYQYKKADYKPERFVYETEIINGEPRFKKDVYFDKDDIEKARKIPVLKDGKQVTFRDLYQESHPAEKGNFEFVARKNENYGVEFEKDGQTVKVYIDNEMFPDMTSMETVRQYTNRMSELFHDNDEYEKYAEEFNDILTNNQLTGYTEASEAKRQKTNVSALHPRMGLQGVITLMQANLGKDALSPIEYTEDQIATFQQMENYMKVDDQTKEKLEAERAKIVKKINAMADISARRISEGTKFTGLKTESEYLSKINTFAADDATFMLDYIKAGADGLNSAYRVFNLLKEDLADKANLSPEKLNRLNKELEQIKQFVGMYDDSTNMGIGFRSLFTKYMESFDKAELTNFESAAARLDKLKDNMKVTMADLAVEQMMPTIERNNASLKKQGYDKYIVSREKARDLILKGSPEDIGWFAHMLGAPVNSTDVVNAAVSNSISDAINYVYESNLDSINIVNDGHAQFIKRVGNNLKTQEEYYKKNYLRKAKYWDVTSRDDKGKPTYGYVEKMAFHQDKLYDVFEDDLRKFKENLPEAKSHEEDFKNQEALNAWIENNKDNQKYVNKDFQKLKSDSYYQVLYGKYFEYNNKYGQNKLNYGIMPQFYNESLMTKFRDKVAGVKGIIAKDKDTKEKLTALGNEVFGEQLGKMDKRGINLDGTIYRSVNSNVTELKDDSKLDYDLHKIMYDFISDAGSYEAKRDVQFNIENIKQLIEGNHFFGIQQRTVGTRDFASEFRAKRIAKEKLKDFEARLKNGEQFTPEVQAEYEKAKDDASGNTFKYVYDKFLGTKIPSRTGRANQQAVEFINDVLYGEDEYDSHVKIGGRVFDMNKFGGKLGLVQAAVNMAGNVVAGANNVLAGNMQMFIEAYGGKHFTKKDLAKAHAQYSAALMKGDFIGDMKNPIKSEITQFGLLFDAIQGEFTNDLGEKISGNLIQRYANTSSLFLLSHAGEHQIQLTGMLALMNATKLKTKNGEEVSVKEAYAKDANGRFKLRSDVTWTKEDKQQFVRVLHGISRTLNGNYNALHKGHIQRYWFGKLVMQYRKYLYPAIVARYGQERVDMEKGTIERGYLSYFVGEFVVKNLIKRQFNLIKAYKNMTPDQKYMARKAMAEIGSYMVLTAGAIAMGANDPDKKNFSQAHKAALLAMLRVHNEIGMYNVDAFAETLQQSRNPIASMRLVTGLAKLGVQIYNPNEVYKQGGNGYKEGDSKMYHKFKQILPKFMTMPTEGINWDGYLNNFKLTASLPK